MGRGTALSEKEQTKIEVLRGLKYSNRDIAKKIKRSHNAVNHYVKDPSNYGTKKTTGPKKKLNSRQTRAIIRLASNKSTSCSKIISELNLPVHSTTVLRALQSSNHMSYQKQSHMPAHTAQHRRIRLEFAKLHMTWKLEWLKVVWSDEKKFNLDGPDGLSYYWHDLRKEKMFSLKRGFGGGSVMIWACFGSFGIGDLAFIDGRLNAAGYCAMLEEYLLPSGRRCGGRNWIFQHDNASIHRAKLTQQWLQDRNIEVIEWPALSPDLNPLENLWGILARRVYANGRQFPNVESLKNAITQEWNGLSLADIQPFASSMPNRIFEVIRLNGNKTKY